MTIDMIKFLLSSLAFPILVAFATTKITYRKEARKSILEKRVPLYSDIQNRVESLMYDRTQIFDKKYRNSVLKYKPQVELFASQKAKCAYWDFYQLVEDYCNRYQTFCEENDPRRDKANYETVIDESGEEHETTWVTSMDIEYYTCKEDNYKKNNCPDDELLKQKVDALYTAMRKDLGTNR